MRINGRPVALRWGYHEGQGCGLDTKELSDLTSLGRSGSVQYVIIRIGVRHVYGRYSGFGLGLVFLELTLTLTLDKGQRAR